MADRKPFLWVVTILLLFFAIFLIGSNLPLNYHMTKSVFSPPVEQDIMSKNYQEFRARLTDSLSGEVPGGTTVKCLLVSDMIVEEFHTLFGVRTLTITAPYVLYSVRDVGTAGRTDWAFHSGLFSLTWENDMLIPHSAVELGETTFSVVAGENTALALGLQNSSVSNRLDLPLQYADLLEPKLGAVLVTAVTIDSGNSPNAAAVGTISWKGQVVHKFGPILQKEIAFILDGPFQYISNLHGGQ